MTQPANNMSQLTKDVTDYIVKGFSMEETAEKVGISVADTVSTWQEYVSNRSVMSREESWVLHLMRLEKLLTKANAILENDSDPDNVENMLKIMDRIEMLQNLNLSRKQEAENELFELTRQQGILMVTALVRFGNEMRGVIEQALNQKTIKAIRGELLDDYENKIGELTNKALETIVEEDK